MDDELKDQTTEVLHHIRSPKLEEETKSIRMQEQDPLFSLKTVLYDFFKKRLIVIQGEDTFKALVKEAIVEKIQSNEVSIPQLINLYSEISSQSTFSTNAILDIFKPTKDGSVSPIVQPHHADDGMGASASEIGSLTPSEAEALNQLGGILDKLKKGNPKVVNED